MVTTPRALLIMLEPEGVRVQEIDLEIRSPDGHAPLEVYVPVIDNSSFDDGLTSSGVPMFGRRVFVLARIERLERRPWSPDLFVYVEKGGYPCAPQKPRP
jgi:hypothetical protein